MLIRSKVHHGWSHLSQGPHTVLVACAVEHGAWITFSYHQLEQIDFVLVSVYQLRVLLVNSVLFELHFEELVESHVVRNHRRLLNVSIEEAELVVSLDEVELGFDERCLLASGEAHDSVS